jgi:uncharacterized protein YdaU (DUF1376 family)
MNNAPAFQHYANDFLAEIAFLSMEGRGVFITLKSYYWVKNGLPNDMRLLARLCALSEDAFTEIWNRELVDLFNFDTDNLYLDDLEQQRIYQEEKRGKAKASADARWKNANAMRTQCTSTSTPTSKHAEKEKPFQAQTAVEKDIPVIRMIWQFGVDLLKQSGVKEKSARSLLGKLAKEYTNDLLAECIAVTMSKNPVNVEEFLIGTLKQRKNGSNQTNSNGYLSTAEKRLRDEIESEQLIRDLLDEAERESVPSEHHRVIEAHSSVS